MKRKFSLEGEYALTYNQSIQFNFYFMNNFCVNPQSLDTENPLSNLQSISDQNLYSLCKTYGARALEWRQKFIGLLPEVNRRKLYEKKGFESIFVFAKKLAGLSEKQVRRVLNLEEKFENVPVLRELLVNGEVSVNKLARVASIATVGNQEFLAERVRILSQGAVETMVRDERWMIENAEKCGANPKVVKNENGLFKPEVDVESVRAHTFGQLNLSSEVQQKLLELQQKGLDLDQLLLEFLKKREEEIAHKKEQITEEVLRKEEEKVMGIKVQQNQNDVRMAVNVPDALPSRYIPRAVRKIIQEEHGTKCSIKNCQNPAKTIHHTQRFSLSRSHDPHYLAPLCKEHHALAHAVDVRCQEIKNRLVWR